MDVGSLTVGLIVGAALGALIGWLGARSGAARQLAEASTRPSSEAAAARARADEMSKRLAQLEAEAASRDRALSDGRQEATALKQDLARVTAELEAERRAGADRRALLEQTDARLREVFGALSMEALQRNSQQFLDLARTSLGDLQKHATADLDHRQKSLGDLLGPLREALGRVDAKLQEVDRLRAGSESKLDEQLRTLALATNNLERALRTPHVRGGWGEIQLRRVVEMAGMIEHCHFVQREAATTEDGRLIPDLIIKLPGGRNIIVDAKVPYLAFRDAVEAPDESTRAARLRDHARQVREHILQLSSKAYWNQFQPAPEFVFMFLPGEGYFSAALQQDAALIEFGADKRVIPASPLTLIALLRAVAYGWQQQQIAESAQQVSALGRDLYDRIRTMAGHFEDMGRGLGRAVDSYNNAIGALERRVLVTARRFKELGVSASEEIAEPTRADQRPRALQAPEMADLFGEDVVEAETVAADEED